LGRLGTSWDVCTRCVQSVPLYGLVNAASETTELDSSNRSPDAADDEGHNRRVTLIERQRDPQRERSGHNRATTATLFLSALPGRPTGTTLETDQRPNVQVVVGLVGHIRAAKDAVRVRTFRAKRERSAGEPKGTPRDQSGTRDNRMGAAPASVSATALWSRKSLLGRRCHDQQGAHRAVGSRPRQQRPRDTSRRAPGDRPRSPRSRTFRQRK
jgi:hypothetical protein